MDESIIKHDGMLGEIFPEFVWDPYRITLELSRELSRCNHISSLKQSQHFLTSNSFNELNETERYFYV